MFSFEDFDLKSQMKSLAWVEIFREKMKDAEGRNPHWLFLENLATRESLLALHMVLLIFFQGDWPSSIHWKTPEEIETNKNMSYQYVFILLHYLCFQMTLLNQKGIREHDSGGKCLI